MLQTLQGRNLLLIWVEAVHFVQLGDQAAGVALVSRQQVSHSSSHLCICHRGVRAQKEPTCQQQDPRPAAPGCVTACTCTASHALSRQHLNALVLTQEWCLDRLIGLTDAQHWV